MAEDNKAKHGPKPSASWQGIGTSEELPIEHQQAFAQFDKFFVRNVCRTLNEVFPELIGEVDPPPAEKGTGDPDGGV